MSELSSKLLVCIYRSLLLVDNMLEAGESEGGLNVEDCSAARLGTELSLEILEQAESVVCKVENAPVADRRQVNLLLSELKVEENGNRN